MNYYNQYNPYQYGAYRIEPDTIYEEETQILQMDLYNIFSYPENLDNALSQIEKAVSGENEDRQFYTYLLDEAPSDEDAEIITGIRDDEIKHFDLFHQIYYEITGMPVPQQNEEEFIPPSSYCDGLARALLGEQRAVARYRQILYAMQTSIHYNMLTEIITDEIRHGLLYNFLYSKNECDE